MRITFVVVVLILAIFPFGVSAGGGQQGDSSGTYEYSQAGTVFQSCHEQVLLTDGSIRGQYHIKNIGERYHSNHHYNYVGVMGIGLTTGHQYIIQGIGNYINNQAGWYSEGNLVLHNLYTIRMVEQSSGQDWELRWWFQTVRNGNDELVLNIGEYEVVCP